MNEGYIYVLSNPSFASDIYKIGVTHRNPEGRIDELGRPTGVPTPFVLEYAEFVPHAMKAERLIHGFLSVYRLNERREFFKCNTRIIIDIIRKTADELRYISTINPDNHKITITSNYPSVSERSKSIPEFGICNFVNCYEKATGIAGAGVRYCSTHLKQWEKC